MYEVQIEMDNIAFKNIYSFDNNGYKDFDIKTIVPHSKAQIKNTWIVAEDMLVFDMSCNPLPMLKKLSKKFDKKVVAYYGDNLKKVEIKPE